MRFARLGVSFLLVILLFKFWLVNYQHSGASVVLGDQSHMITQREILLPNLSPFNITKPDSLIKILTLDIKAI